VNTKGTEISWPFDQAPNTAALTTRQVIDLKSPIRHLIHYDDGTWAFLCGTTSETDDYRVVHMSHILELDDTLREVADLPLGWSAWREDGQSPWERFQEDSEAE
jgi:hypothetical protein